MSEPQPTFRSPFPIFFCEPGQAPLRPESVQSSILPAQAQVQVNIADPAPADQFSSATSPLLTAFRPETIITPPIPPGPTPAITQLLRRQAPGGTAIISVERGLPTSTTYVISGTAGAGEWLTVEADGYFEIQVQGNPAPSSVAQGDNRFTADVVVTGMYTDPAEDWGQQIHLGLVLNVVQIDFTQTQYVLPTDTVIQATATNFSFGPGQPTIGLQWNATAKLWPPEPEDYMPPIQHVLGTPGAETLGPVSTDGFMYMTPPGLVVISQQPSNLPNIVGEGQVGAFWWASSTSGQFTLPQSFFNGSITGPSNPLSYEIT